MAHEVETAMYVKAPAWHKLGNVLSEVPNTDEAIIASGLNWNVEKRALFAEIDGVKIETPMNGIFRNTDNQFLGECRDRYQLFQNAEAFEWCRPLSDSKLWNYEAAGSLKMGQTCWILLKQGEIELAKNDIIKEYLMMTWSHDGSKAITVMPTSIRVVCNNTLTSALKSEGFKSKIRHTMAMIPKLEEIKSLYSETAEAFKNQQTAFKMLLDTPMTDVQIEEYVEKILVANFNSDDEKKGRGLTILNNTRNLYLDMIKNGSGLASSEVAGTAFAAFQGISEATEHYLGGNRVKDRGENILFGNGGKIVESAFDLAMAYA